MKVEFKASHDSLTNFSHEDIDEVRRHVMTEISESNLGPMKIVGRKIRLQPGLEIVSPEGSYWDSGDGHFFFQAATVRTTYSSLQEDIYGKGKLLGSILYSKPILIEVERKQFGRGDFK